MDNTEPTEQISEPTQKPFKYEVTSEKSVSIDFSEHADEDACIMLVELQSEDQNVKVPSAEVKVFVSTNAPEKNKIEICSFSPENTGEKNVSFIANAEAEPKIIVEGPETVIVSGVFSKPISDDNEEEEEEESAEEVKE